MKRLTKSIDTLVDDIYELFDKGHDIDDKNLEEFSESLSKTIAERLKGYKSERESYLRLSAIGKPDRQLYYEVNNCPKESLQPNAKIKFLFGDILECLLILLAKESGHKVEEEQKRVEIEGVVGHKDCRIDGVTVDIKSASSYSFKKFQQGTLYKDDPFGYISQISSYVQGDEEVPEDGAFLAIDKQLGSLSLLKIPASKQTNVRKRIKEVKKFVNKSDPPPKCYDPVPDGKSGNLKLAVGCSYCPFKHECWKDANQGKGVRTFLYSTGPRHLVNVEREPDVPEIN